MLNTMLAGVGGQGTILVSRLIGAAAIESGLSVRGTETIGMAQRGGSVVSHVRMGENIHSPLIRLCGADIIIAFEPGEAVRALPFLKQDGLLVLSDRAVQPVYGALQGNTYRAETMLEYLKDIVPGCLILDGEELIRRCESAKVVNVALLGAAMATGVFPFGEEELKKVLMKRIPEKFHALNLRALEIGYSMAAR